MNSHLKSVGKIFPSPLIYILLVQGLTIGCVMNPTKDTLSRGSDTKLSDTKEELSLKKDSEEIAKLRKNIPAEKRAENDDLRDVLTTLGEVKKAPNEHREKFESQMRKIREKQRTESRKSRDDFNKEERRTREAFLVKMKTDRDRFNRSKSDSDEKKEFYGKQESKRREFFEDERDKRKDFESDMRQKEADRTALYKEKSDAFYKELKIYTTTYNEQQKAAREKERLLKAPAGARVPPRSGSSAAAPDASDDPQLKYLDPNAAPDGQ